MEKKISKIEFEQLNKIAALYKKNLYKDALFLAHDNRQKIPTLDNIPFFHNLTGLINLSLKDWDQCIKDFEKALMLDKNFTEAHLNMGLAYYDIGELEKSFQEFLEAINLKKDFKKPRDAIIQVLTFFKSSLSKKDIFSITNNKLQELSYNIDFSTTISDEKIINFYNYCQFSNG